jgi:NAD(P)-dependent dehydrogenase (short-subunit alcohol dehydrogenase family)
MCVCVCVCVLPALQVTNPDLHALIDTNITGLVWALKHQTAAIAKSASADSWGVILNTSSSAAERIKPGLEGFGIYAVCKRAMDMLTNLAALEASSLHVRVNSVRSGAVTTDSAVGMFGGRESYDKIMPTFQLGGAQPQTPAELAQFVLFLADNRTGRFFNGSNLLVDGGYSVM